MEHSGGSWEDQNAKRSSDSQGPALKTSENNVLLGTELGAICVVFCQRASLLCLVPKSLGEAEFERIMLICQVEEALRCHNVKEWHSHRSLILASSIVRFKSRTERSFLKCTLGREGNIGDMAGVDKTVAVRLATLKRSLKP